LLRGRRSAEREAADTNAVFLDGNGRTEFEVGAALGEERLKQVGQLRARQALDSDADDGRGGDSGRG